MLQTLCIRAIRVLRPFRVIGLECGQDGVLVLIDVAQARNQVLIGNATETGAMLTHLFDVADAGFVRTSVIVNNRKVEKAAYLQGMRQA